MIIHAKIFRSFFAMSLLVFSIGITNAQEIISTKIRENIENEIYNYISYSAEIIGNIKIDTFYIRPRNSIEFHFKRSLGEYPFREDEVKEVYQIIQNNIPQKYATHKLRIIINDTPLEDLSSRYFSNIPSSFKPMNQMHSAWVTNNSKVYKTPNGLQNKHIALWQSHGYYYEAGANRWEWQRARMFQTVEDIFTQSYVVPFLVPMLENAGAYVVLPRERDTQNHEIIVDNGSLYYYEMDGVNNKWDKAPSPGFSNPKDFYTQGENPFKMGDARFIQKTKNSRESGVASWTPSFPEEGEYAVYVSYISLPNSSSTAKYIIKHNGGETEFLVNQRIGGNTWVYLGTFFFDKGENSQGVYLDNIMDSKETQKSVIVADAVKFGGGIGNIARMPDDPHFEMYPETSGYPRYLEGARYWLQWSGFADTVYSANENLNDYKDDYMSRGIWVNALTGGSSVNPDNDGYRVPIDLSIGFHTDAGITPSDSTIGTLAIYSQFSHIGNKLPTGETRLISRELADIVQTQIVEDIRSSFDPNWSRRGLWDREYSEARTPMVPALLLELLSHQNFSDMKYGLNPEFKFLVSRSIYKGILKFLAYRDNYNYVIQPLPVKNFKSELIRSESPKIKLSWSPRIDNLEISATPKAYVVYTRTEAGFDNGVLVQDTSFITSITPGKISSFKVVAINEGGQSFPSEILSVGLTSEWETAKTALIVNAFDRVSAAESFEIDSTYSGFLNSKDGGVAYIKDYSHSGAQFNFTNSEIWTDDEAPGHGASYASHEPMIIAGNTFDYPYVHGTALFEAGYNFFSTSVGAVEDIDLSNISTMDIILGKQISKDGILIPLHFQKIIKRFAQRGGNLIISGGNIASETWGQSLKFKEVEKADSLNRIAYSWHKELNDLQNMILEKYNSTSVKNDSLGGEYLINDPVRLAIIDSSLISLNKQLQDIILSTSNLSNEISIFNESVNETHLSRKFFEEVFKFKLLSDRASFAGALESTQNPFGINSKLKLQINTRANEDTYAIESPDAIIPIGLDSWPILRYSETNNPAAIAYRSEVNKTVALGFPIETISNQEDINIIIKEILNFFDND